MLLGVSTTLEGMQTLAERLRQERKSRELSQQELARLAGVSQGLVSQIELGTNAGTQHIVSIARVLNVNPRWLSTGCGPKTPVDLDWPFSFSKEQYLSLSEQDRSYINMTVERLLLAIETSRQNRHDTDVSPIDKMSEKLQHILPETASRMSSLEGGNKDEHPSGRRRKDIPSR